VSDAGPSNGWWADVSTQRTRRPVERIDRDLSICLGNLRFESSCFEPSARVSLSRRVSTSGSGRPT